MATTPQYVSSMCTNDVAGADFVGKTLTAISFNTTRGGKVPGDDIYKAYDVVFQQP